MQTQKDMEPDYIYSNKTDVKKKTIQLAAQKNWKLETQLY